MRAICRALGAAICDIITVRMQFLKLVRRRSFLSELTYTALNIALAIGVALIVCYTESTGLAILLVLISKWRVLAVRPRYWWANVRSNMVDFIVGASIAVHINTVNLASLGDATKLWLIIALTVAYIVWLLFIKPRSKRSYVVAQSSIATFLGMSALFIVAYNWPLSIVVVLAWLIGSSASYHILSAYDNETQGFLLSLFVGVFFAELSWVAYHWAIAYPLPFFPALMVPQVAIITTLIGFLAYKTYDSFYHHSKIRLSDILLPLLLTVSVLLVLLVLFNRVGTAI